MRGSAASRVAAVESLNAFDVVVLQHEFGIYGGEDGGDVLDLVRALRVPLIVVLHTVPRRPTPGQRRIIEELAVLADRLVVQSTAARTRLLEQYVADAEMVRTIPHGARANLAAGQLQRDGSRPPLVLTWGLLGPDKGIEWGIDAIARLADLEPPPRYVVVGETHPRVLEEHGEEYRDSLIARAAALGVGDLVEFDNAYYDTESLLARVRQADIVLLPYLSREQVVSGVLVEAIASGKPVVATRFPHAAELLADGSGLVVPHEDADAIAHALHSLLTVPARLSRAEGRRPAPGAFVSLLGKRRRALPHARSRGLAQAPTRARADVSSAVIPAPARTQRHRGRLRACEGDGAASGAWVLHRRRCARACRGDAGTAANAAAGAACVDLSRVPRAGAARRWTLPQSVSSVDRRWLDEVGSDDATGRGLWAVGTAAAAETGREQRERALAVFEAGADFHTSSPRANAFAVLGAAELLAAAAAPPAAAYTLLERAAAGLGRVPTDARWPWPELRLAYANAVLAEARIAAGAALGNERLLAEGLELLAWLVETETNGDHFSFTPVGGWAVGEPRPGFDQQPIDAAAMADACARAFDVTGEPEWADAALLAAAWFLGANDVEVLLLDEQSGGGRDGLTRTG